MEIGAPVAKEKNKIRILICFLVFIIYIFAAAQPIPVESILVPRWLSSLESNYPVYLNDTSPAEEPASLIPGERAPALIPFELDGRFGYVDGQGRFALNRIKQGYVSLSDTRWSEYEARPSRIEVRNPGDDRTLEIEGEGYPLFLDNRIFLIGNGQTSLSLADAAGRIRWTYDFAAPLTDIDAAAGLILAGSLDGTVELLNDEGRRIFFFEPGGSRLSVILGCRISRDGSRLAIISGYDDQRFLLLEKLGDSYKVSYHEFVGDGFRRAVHMAFIDDDRRVVFEREGGLGIYEIAGRNSRRLALEGSIAAIDGKGEGGLLFVVNAPAGRRKELVEIRFPATITMKAPFTSDTVFLSREGSRLYVGGGNTLASFDLDRR
jgi:hypothetical protein